MGGMSQLLTLRVDDEQFGIASDLVREVARLPRLTRVPHAPPALMGLANVRGTVVPVLSLARLVDRKPGGERRIVIVDAGEPVALAVDAVARLVRTNDTKAAAIRAIDVVGLIAGSITANPQRRSQRSALAADDAAETSGVDLLALVAFAIGQQEFALPLGAVEEVLRLPPDVARLPHADDVVVGSTAMRGALLPLLSLRALLALPATVETPRSRVLVVRIGNHRVGLVVDAMRSILRVAEDHIDPVPHVLARGHAETRIQAICRLDDGKRLVSVLSVDHLLRDDITARLLQASTEEQEGMTVNVAGRAAEQFLMFRIGGAEFGLPISAVEEVAALPARLTRLPRAPAFLRGVMNLRGQVVPVIDQAQRFGEAPATSAKCRVVVARIGDLLAGFVVDAVSEVLSIELDALRPAPDLGTEETRVFERVANLTGDGRIVLIVSPRELLNRAEQDLLRDLGKKGTAPVS